MRVRLAAGLLATGFSFTALADSVACYVTYGGETRRVEADATNNPYLIAPTAIGSYFLFRVVYRQEPADLAGIKLYTYADRDSGPVIIHQASYALPISNAAVYGFSGLNFVYEPVRDGELQYWCELKTEVAK